MAKAVTTSKSQLSAKQQTARREASADWGLGTGDCRRVPAQSTVTGTVLSGALAAGGSLQTTAGHLCGREDGWVQSLVEKAALDLSCCGGYSSGGDSDDDGGGGGAVERLPGRVRPQATDQPSGGRSNFSATDQWQAGGQDVEARPLATRPVIWTLCKCDDSRLGRWNGWVNG